MVLNVKLIKLDYAMNKSPGPQQILQIAKQWNMNDFDFLVGLIVSKSSECRINIYICFICRIGLMIGI
jgi:hypothetical protein